MSYQSKASQQVPIISQVRQTFPENTDSIELSNNNSRINQYNATSELKNSNNIIEQQQQLQKEIESQNSKQISNSTQNSKFKGSNQVESADISNQAIQLFGVGLEENQNNLQYATTLIYYIFQVILMAITYNLSSSILVQFFYSLTTKQEKTQEFKYFFYISYNNFWMFIFLAVSVFSVQILFRFNTKYFYFFINGALASLTILMLLFFSCAKHFNCSQSSIDASLVIGNTILGIFYGFFILRELTQLNEIFVYSKIKLQYIVGIFTVFKYLFLSIASLIIYFILKLNNNLQVQLIVVFAISVLGSIMSLKVSKLRHVSVQKELQQQQQKKIKKNWKILILAYIKLFFSQFLEKKKQPLILIILIFYYYVYFFEQLTQQYLNNHYLEVNQFLIMKLQAIFFSASSFFALIASILSKKYNNYNIMTVIIIFTQTTVMISLISQDQNTQLYVYVLNAFLGAMNGFLQTLIFIQSIQEFGNNIQFFGIFLFLNPFCHILTEITYFVQSDVYRMIVYFITQIVLLIALVLLRVNQITNAHEEEILNITKLSNELLKQSLIDQQLNNTQTYFNNNKNNLSVAGISSDQELSYQSFLKRYIKISHIKSGGQSSVFKYYDKEEKENVAIKIYTGTIKNGMKIMNTELESLRRIQQHPHIIKIRNYILHANEDNTIFTLYIVMELAQKSLQDLIDTRKKQRNQSLSNYELIEITEQISQALNYLQQNYQLAHRDVKPSNILLCQNRVWKIADFGISKFYSIENLEKSQTLVGTHLFNSPQQMMNYFNFNNASSLKSKISQQSASDIMGIQFDQFKCDVFSLGLTLYIAATFQRIENFNTNFVFLQQKLSEFKLNKNYDESIKQIIISMLSWEELTRPSFAIILQIFTKPNLNENQIF